MNTKSKKYRMVSYIIYAALLGIVHSFFQTGTNDDGWFAQVLDKYSVFEYLPMRYETWTSRLPMEWITILLTRWNPWIWKILNIAVVLVLVYGLSEVFAKEKKENSELVFMFLIPVLPISMYSSAGWITTTVNYLWPITAAIVALIPISWWERDKKFRKWQYLVFLISGIFACFQEQAAAVLFASYSIYIGYTVYRKRKVSLFHIVMLGTSLFLMFSILLCPGNEVRTLSETGRWFPEFAELAYWEKLLIGYLNTLSYYVSCSEYNAVFLIFTATLFVSVLNKTRNKWAGCMAFIPLLITGVWGFVGRVIIQMNITTRIYWMGLIQNDRLPGMGVYPYSSIWIEGIVFLILIILICVSLFWVFGKTADYGLAIVVLGATLCSKIIMGFSPTVYASGSRTSTIGSISVFVLIYLCMQKCIKKENAFKFILKIVPFYLIAFVTAMIGNINF